MLSSIDGILIPTEKATLPVNDSSALYGDSLFETLLVVNGVALWLEPHLQRLSHSARLIELPLNLEQVKQQIDALLKQLDSGPYRLRITQTRGAAPRPDTGATARGQTILTAQPYTVPTAKEKEQGAICITAPNKRVNPLSHLPQLKSGNYMDCLYARKEAHRQGAFEALFVHPELGLLEGATTNLFIVHDQTLKTPPLGHLVLNGIVRQKVIEAASVIGLSVSETAITLAACTEASEAFLCNSLIGLYPIKSINSQTLHRSNHWRTLSAQLNLAQNETILISSKKNDHPPK